MSDFLDRFGDQLRAVQAVPPASPRRGVGLRRGLLVAACALLVAAPAVAIVGPWDPTVGRPEVEGPVTVDGDALPAAALAALAVLRRSQTEADRTGSEPLLRTIAGHVDGVRLAGVRRLALGWALVPVASMTAAGGETRSDGLCITDGKGIACGPAATLRQHGIGLTAVDVRATTVVGLVPDGVARVRYVPDGGTPVQATVSGNFYRLSFPTIATGEQIPAPADDGYHGPDAVPAPPTTSGVLEWLDADGAVVGPAIRRVG